LNFTLAGLDASRNAVQRLLDFEARLGGLAPESGAAPTRLPVLAREAVAGFREAMDDDFNSADAMAALFTFVNRVNSELDGRSALTPEDRDAAVDALRSMDSVLGILEVARASRAVDDDLASWVEERIEARKAARAARDFTAADAIRDELTAKGIVLEDGPQGTRWKVV
jgi:cysteinyl-tRNA synthetase